jgi:hypothetical protein
MLRPRPGRLWVSWRGGLGSTDQRTGQWHWLWVPGSGDILFVCDQTIDPELNGEERLLRFDCLSSSQATI